MTQNAWAPLVPAADNGTTLSNKLNGLVPAIYSTNRGTSRPAYAVAGMLWVDSSTDTNEKLYLFDGAHDILLMAWDATTGVLTFGGGGSIAEFDATKAYQADDLMIRNGGIYKATQATGPGAYNAAHWTQIDAAAVSVPPAILRAPTTTAQNTITQSVDDQVPLKIAPSATSTAKQLEIGSSFSVDKDGALYAAGNLGVGVIPAAGYKARITADASHQFGLFMDSRQYTVGNPYAFYAFYGGGSAQATGFYATAAGSGVSGSIGYDSDMPTAEANKSLSRHFRARVGGAEVFTVSGNGAVTAAGNITAASDKRLKSNIKPLNDALASIAAIDAYTFDRTDIKTTRQAGVIAQELLAVLPEAVQKADDERGTLSVNYGAVASLAIAGCKALQSEIETLSVKNRLLEQRLERLEILMDQSMGD